MRAIRRWGLVGSLAVCGFLIGGGCIAILGPIFGPMMRELGWSNARIATLATSYTIGNLASNPVVGAALDRFGARRVLLLGAASAAAGLMCASQSHSWILLAACFALIGIGMTGVYLPSAFVITQSLPTQKGLGMGIFMGALSVGAAVLMTVVSTWLNALGWRHVMLRLAVINLALLPMISLCVRTDERRTTAQPTAIATTNNFRSEVLGRLLSLPFLLAALSSALFTIGMLGIYYDVVDILVKAGYSPRSAALVFGSTWLVSGAGSLVFGLLADRFGPVRVLAAVVFACACGTLCLFGTPHPRYGVVCLVAFVVLWGSTGNGFTQLVPAVFVERFGPTHLGAVLGAQFAIAGVTGALAPMLTGLLVDRSGDYHVAIAVSASATLVSAVLASLIGFSQFVPRFPGAVHRVSQLK